MRSTTAILLLLVATLVGCQKNGVEPVPDSYWETADPAALGMQADSLSRAIELARDMPNFYALLVARHNKLATEAYFRGKRATSLYHLRSVTKNFVSALAGMAIEQGLVDSLNASIKSDFPAIISGEKEAITVGHLLNMASGLTWDEDTEVIPLIQHQIPDPVTAILSRPLEAPPGIAYNYNSVSTHIVAEIISQRAIMPFEQYADEQLLTPLGITSYAWERDPEGRVWGGFGLQLTARDVAKLGQLYLDGGQWQGAQLVPADWVDMSFVAQIDVPTSPTDYSLQWRVSESTGTTIMFGLGFGGQVLMVIPEKDMVIVALQEHFVSFDQSGTQWQNFASRIFGPIFRSVE